MKIFVPGRICLFGEHSDWAGGYRRINADIEKGYTLICGTDQGVYAEVNPHPTSLVLTSITNDGVSHGPVEIPMHPEALLAEAQKGGFWSYIAGVAYQALTNYHVRGLVIHNYHTDLPVKKGLSSSAAICVLAARAFNRIYDLKLTVRGTNYYLVEHAEYDTAGRTRWLYLGASSLGATPVLVNEDHYYPWTSQGGRLQYSKSGIYTNWISLQKLEYSYDANGNISSIKDYKAGVDASHPQQQSFEYDNLDRLLSAGATGGLNGNGDYAAETYDYSTSTGNLSSKTGVGSYSYTAQNSGCAEGVLPARPHAVTTAGTTTYCYDQDGNMTRRDPSGEAVYNFQHDAENRLVSASGSATASFVYDGDGARVKGTVGGVTTAYIGSHFEWTGSTGTMLKYYYAGGARVAMRQGSTMYFLLADHLGSTTVSVHLKTDFTLEKLAELRYMPWGENRASGYAENLTPTERRYTGQVKEEIGLYFYQARWYDPLLGRMVQADTIVPGAGNPMAWDRYAYGLNSPVKYVDPTGHAICPYSECDIVLHPVSGRAILRNGSLYKAAKSIVRDLGGKNDLEAMAIIVEAGASAYRTWDRLLPHLSKIFIGVNSYGPGSLIKALGAGGCGGVGREPRDCPGTEDFFRDTGFHPDFRDSHNQPYHVWGYIAETAIPGIAILGLLGQQTAVLGNNFHEIGQSNNQAWFDLFGIDHDIAQPGWGTSWNDFTLSEAGMGIGAMITNQAISPKELADILRSLLGVGGPGSGGRYNDLMQTRGPLAGQ